VLIAKMPNLTQRESIRVQHELCATIEYQSKGFTKMHQRFFVQHTATSSASSSASTPLPFAHAHTLCSIVWQRQAHIAANARPQSPAVSASHYLNRYRGQPLPTCCTALSPAHCWNSNSACQRRTIDALQPRTPATPQDTKQEYYWSIAAVQRRLQRGTAAMPRAES
jgi:hypothetical protein